MKFIDHPSNVRLEILEDWLIRLLQPAGKFPHIFISSRYLKRFEEDWGRIFVIQNSESAGPVVFVSCNDTSQEQAVQTVFKAKGTSPICQPERLKSGRLMIKYPLPTNISVAAQFIIEIFRGGYGLDDLASIGLHYLEKAA